MKYDSENNPRELIFSSGKSVYAYAGIIGINGDLETFYGYDGDFPEYEGALSAAEKIELADHMIGLWAKYKANAVAGLDV